MNMQGLRRYFHSFRNAKSVREARLELEQESANDLTNSQLHLCKRMLRLGEYASAFQILARILENSANASDDVFKDIILTYAKALANKGKNKEGLFYIKKGLKRLPDDGELKELELVFTLMDCNLGKWRYSSQEQPNYEKFARKYKYNEGFLNDVKFKIRTYVSEDKNCHYEILRKVTRLCKAEIRKKNEKKLDYIYYLGICLYLQHMVFEATECFDIVLDAEPDYENEFVQFEYFDDVKSEGKSVKESDRKIKQYKTERGIFVKSKIEALIDNFYHRSSIKAHYEPIVVLGTHVIHPDWELEIDGEKIYHEHIGCSSSKKRMDWKRKLFDEHNLNYFCTDWNDEENIDEAIMRKLEDFRK